MKDSFLLYYELHDDRCEDAEPLNFDSLIGVFDGMGGAGSIQFEDLEGKNRTNAYIASRIVRDSTLAFYKDNLAKLLSAFINPDEQNKIIEELIESILKDLKQFADKTKLGDGIRVKSRMIQLLPTTMAVAIIVDKKETIDVMCLWAGDSRCYILTPEKGLQQLTVDDLRLRNDAMENIVEDSPMSNYVHLPLVGDDMNPHFTINCKVYRDIPAPCIVFAATDGCFGYVGSPMEFEYLILESIKDAKENYLEIKNLGGILKEKLIALPTADDASLAGIIFRNEISFVEFYEKFNTRYKIMFSEYIEKIHLENSNKDKIRTLMENKRSIEEKLEMYRRSKSEEFNEMISGRLRLILENRQKLPKAYRAIEPISTLYDELSEEIKDEGELELSKKFKINYANLKKSFALKTDRNKLSQIRELSTSCEHIDEMCRTHGNDIFHTFLNIVESIDSKKILSNYLVWDCDIEIRFIRNVYREIEEREIEISEIERELNHFSEKSFSINSLWESYKNDYELELCREK